jgi:hypothetical protein
VALDGDLKSCAFPELCSGYAGAFRRQFGVSRCCGLFNRLGELEMGSADTIGPDLADDALLQTLKITPTLGHDPD